MTTANSDSDANHKARKRNETKRNETKRNETKTKQIKKTKSRRDRATRRESLDCKIHRRKSITQSPPTYTAMTIAMTIAMTTANDDASQPTQRIVKNATFTCAS